MLPEKITLQYFKILATLIHTLCGIATVFCLVLLFIFLFICFSYSCKEGNLKVCSGPVE